MPIEGLNEEYADNETIKRYDDVNAMAKGLLETKSMVGNSLRIPGEDASDEDRSSFYTKIMEKAPNLMLKPNFDDTTQSREFFQTLGMPSAAEQYELPEIQVPEGVEVNVNQMEAFKNIAHKYGLTKDQYSGVVADFMKGQIDTASLTVDQHKAAMKTLREEWGMAADDRIAAVAAAEATEAPAEIIDAIKGGKADPGVVKWLRGIGEQIGDEVANFQREKSARTNFTPDEARMQLAEMQNNKDHPINNPDSSGYSAAIKKMVMLNAAISGSKCNEAEFDKSMKG